MKSLLCAVAAFATLAASAAEPLRVVASVTRIHEEGAPMTPGVYIDFTVHAPAAYRGLPVTMFAVGVSRRDRRVEFPIGALFALQLPEPAVDALKTAKWSEEHVQGQIDAGVKPEMISQLVMPAQVDLATLPAKPVPVDAR